MELFDILETNAKALLKYGHKEDKSQVGRVHGFNVIECDNVGHFDLKIMPEMVDDMRKD